MQNYDKVRTVEYTVEFFKEQRISICSSSLVDFVLELPYLLHQRYIPPFLAINDAFEFGEETDGESRIYKWAPFSITEEEYQELVHQIRSRGGYQQIDCPDWVKTNSDWFVRLYEHLYKLLPQEHLALRAELISIKKRMQDAIKSHHREIEEELENELEEAEKRLFDFWQRHLKQTG